MKHCFGIFVACFLFFGCNKSQTISPDNFNSCNNKRSNIDGGVEISLWENLAMNSANRTLTINSTTNRLMPCAGFGLNICSKKIDNSFYISFDELTVPDNCPAIVTRPLCPIDLGVVVEGVYNINFRINSNEYAGHLTVSDTSYVVDVKNIKDSDIVVYNDTLHKVPSNTMWGDISYFDEKDSGLAKKVLSELKGLGAIDTFYTPANYGYFLVDQQSRISFWDADRLNYSTNFIFKNYGDFIAIKNLVESYGVKGSDFFQVTVFTSEGPSFRSF